MNFFQSENVCVVITGASRGFGVAISTTLAEHYRSQFAQPPLESNPISPAKTKEDDKNPTVVVDHRNPKLLFILIARNGDKLIAVGNRLQQIDNRINFISIECDLSSSSATSSVSETVRRKLNESRFVADFDHLILVHNAGSVGDPNCLCRTISDAKLEERENYYRLNLLSVMELTGLFLRLRSDSPKPDMKVHIINVSSLAAVSPFKGMVDYCVTKAAREAYFRSLIHEEVREGDSSEPKKSLLRVLNYAPGPLETEMLEQLRNDGFQREAFQQLTALTPEQSAKKMMELLELDQYSNGAHIDYYDP